MNYFFRIILIAGWFLILPDPVWTQEGDSPSDTESHFPHERGQPSPWTQEKFRSGLETRVKVPMEFFSQITLQPYLEMFLENYFDHAIYQLPAMGGYSYPDNYIFSLLGNSWLWNRYSFRGHNMNDPFFSGYMLHRMPMYDRGVEIDALTGELRFFNFPEGKQFYGKVSTGYLGPDIPYYKVFHDPYSQQSPQLRDRPPTESRRRNRFTVEGFSKDYIDLDPGRLWFYTYTHIRDRVINDFDEYGNATPYTELFSQLSFHGEWEQENGNRPLGWLATYTTRDQLYSEFYFHREETARLDDFALSGYYHGGDKFRHGQILHFNYKGIDRHHPEFSRNLFDLTGEGLDPFYPSGEVFSIAQHSTLDYTFEVVKEDFLHLGGEMSHTLNILNPHREHYSNPVYFKAPEEELLALYVTDWISRPLAYLLMDYRTEISVNRTEEKGFLPYATLGVTLSGMAMNRESLVRIRPTFTLGMHLLNGRYRNTQQRLRVEIGRVNVPFDNELALFVSDLYQTGVNYVWDDRDGDGVLDSGEKSSVIHSTTGGGYRQIDKELGQPHYYYVDIPYTIDFNDTWSLSIAAHYRIFKDQLWVRLDDPEGSGDTITTNDTTVYLPSQGEKHYTVINLPSSRFPDSPHWFNDSPFYMGMATKVTAVGDWYFFSLSFGAYLVNGITSLGNGPLHNSPGTLSEGMADPNAAYRSLGRLDSDRAYVGKLLLAFRFLPELIGVIDFKYRDGQPIGQWNYYVDRDRKQVAFLRNSVSGDNILLYNGEFGTREDALMSLDLRFQYTWALNREQPGEAIDFGLSIYNVIDMGRELAEFSFFSPGTANRNALELQIPRGIEFSVRYRY